LQGQVLAGRAVDLVAGEFLEKYHFLAAGAGAVGAEALAGPVAVVAPLLAQVTAVAAPAGVVRVRPHVSVGVRPDVQVGLRRVELLLARVGATLRGSPWAHSPEPPYVVLAGPDRPSDAAGYPKHLVTVSKVDHRAGSRAEPCLCL